MNSTQKTIKSLAIVFGIFLSIGIISAILFGILMIGSVITGVNLYYNSKDLVSETIEVTEEIQNIRIELNASKLNVKTLPTTGTLSIETYAEKDNFIIDVKKDTLVIKEKRKNVLNINNSEIIIYIPEDLIFNEVEIEIGAGEATISKLETEEINIKMGAGSTEIKELITTKTTKVEGGVGRFEIKSGEVNNLDLGAGVGENIIRAKLTGKTKIENGVGEVKLDIDGKAEDYSITTKLGIGSITLNGKKCANDETYGEGKNSIKVEGGIGEVKITTK